MVDSRCLARALACSPSRRRAPHCTESPQHPLRTASTGACVCFCLRHSEMTTRNGNILNFFKRFGEQKESLAKRQASRASGELTSSDGTLTCPKEKAYVQKQMPLHMSHEVRIHNRRPRTNQDVRRHRRMRLNYLPKQAPQTKSIRMVRKASSHRNRAAQHREQAMARKEQTT